MQALAAIGQGRLIALWDNLFGQLGQPIAQILITRGDISDVSGPASCVRSVFLNATLTPAYKISQRNQYVNRTSVNGGRPHNQ